MTRALACVLPLLLPLFACTGGGGGGGKAKNPGGEESGLLRSVDFSGTSNASGLYNVELEVEEGETALMVSADSTAYLSLEAIYRGSDEVVHWEDWWEDEALTEAFNPYYDQVVVNWPVREEDTRLSAGTWRIQLATTDFDYNYVGGEDIAGTVLLKPDDTFDDGIVRVHLAYAAGLDGDQAVLDAVDGAVARWEEIYAERGLTLELTTGVASDIDADVPEELDSDEILAEAARGDDADVLMVICEEIGGDLSTYGIAGNIPWTTLPMDHAAVAVSSLAHSGANGEFSAEEIRIMGETMAHETGHYLGLYHPVEDGWDSYDAVTDTARCGSTGACESQLGTNLMFPYPLCDGSGCDPQGDLTDGQEGVVQRYTGTL